MSIRRLGLFRSEERWVGGVGGGLAARYGWDPTLVRGLLFLSFFLGGFGLMAYGVAWALLPEQRDGRIHLEQAIRGNFNIALVGAGLAVLSGTGWSGGIGLWRGPWPFRLGVSLFQLAALAVGAWLIYRLVRDRRDVPPVMGDSAYPVPTYSALAEPSIPSVPATNPVPFVAEPTPVTYPVPASPTNYPPPSPAPITEVKNLKPRVLGAGPAAFGIVAGLLFIAGAAMAGLRRTSWSLPWSLDNYPVLAWLGVALVVVGVGIVIAGIRGRSSGGLGTLAIIGLVVAAPWTMVAIGHTDLITVGHNDEVIWVSPGGGGLSITDGTTRPRSVAEAERGFRTTFGSPTIDLTDLDLTGASTDNPIVVPIELTAGSLQVRVPRDVAVEADVRMWGGEISWCVNGPCQSHARVGTGTARLTSDEAVDDGPVLRLFIQHRFGQTVITD